MKRSVGVVVAAAALLGQLAAAAEFSMSYTVPSADAVPIICAPGGGRWMLPHRPGHVNLKARLSWTGPVAGSDSILDVADGMVVTFARTGLPAGTYTFRASVCDSGGCGCDTVVTRVLTDTIPPEPVEVRLVP